MGKEAMNAAKDQYTVENMAKAAKLAD